jgi:hypothetical protein
MSVTLSALPRPATSLVRMLVGEVKVIGSLPEGPVLLCGNHVSYRDVFLFAVVRASSRLLVHPLVFSFPFLKKWALRRGFVQVSIEDAVALLKHGQTVAICPSGNVEVLGEAERPFKTGAVRIAQQAGVSRGLLYHYFPSKRAFFAAIVQVGCDEILDATQPDPSRSPMAQLQASLEAYFDYVESHPHMYRAIFRSAASLEQTVQDVVNRNLDLQANSSASNSRSFQRERI